MIHFFEGFKGPLSTSVQARDALALTEFIFGNSGYGQLNSPEGGALMLNRSTGIYQVPARRVIDPANVLVLGYSMEYQDQNNSTSSGIYCGYALTPAEFSTVTDTQLTFADRARISPILKDQLPVLSVNPYNIASATTINKGLSLRTSSGGLGTTANTLWNEELPGVNFYQKHFYEVVYDFARNKIEMWLDNVQVGIVDYAFSEAQKAMRIRLRLDGSSYYASGSSSATYLYPQLNGMYAATERLGPVSWGLSKPTADAEVSAEFATLPGWNKVNVRQDSTTTTRITTTKSKQKALFKGSTVTGDILAVSVRGRYSSTEQSALEAFGAVKTTLKSNGQEVQQPALAIPKQSSVTPIDLFEKSPFTGVAWTAAELTAMTYGAEIVVTPKVVT